MSRPDLEVTSKCPATATFRPAAGSPGIYSVKQSSGDQPWHVRVGPRKWLDSGRGRRLSLGQLAPEATDLVLRHQRDFRAEDRRAVEPGGGLGEGEMALD